MFKRTKVLLATSLMFVASSQLNAALVNWDIDSANSYVRLNLPLNTSTTISGVGVNIRLRNADNTNWSDTGGRMSRVSGTIATNYSEGVSSGSLTYLSGSHNANSINFSSFRPNPAQFNPSATNASNPNGQYTGTGGAPASFAVRINVNALVVVNATVGFLALRDLQYDAAGTRTWSGPITPTGTPTTGSTQFGVLNGKYDLDANDIGLGLGQLLPDTKDGSIAALLGSSSGLQTNNGGLTITSVNIGLYKRRLDQVIDIPINIDVDGNIITGSIFGHLRAFAVPEPASVSLVATTIIGFIFHRRRRQV